MTEAVNSTTSGIYRKGWAALAVKAAGKASGLRESRIAMDETQTRVVDAELTNSDGPTFAKLMTMAERELGVFISAVTELFGLEQVRLAVEDWLDELVLKKSRLVINYNRSVRATRKSSERLIASD